MGNIKETDVLIIGAGITGCSIARALARYDVNVTVIEREIDVSMGISKTSGSLIYMGLLQAMSIVIKNVGEKLDPEKYINTERMKMLAAGFFEFDKIAHELDIAHKHVGNLCFALNESDLEKINALESIASSLPGGTIRSIDREELHEMEPNLNPDAIKGLLDSTGTISIFGPDYVLALFENARDNGTDFQFETECLGIEERNGFQIVSTNRGAIKARFVINCAGKYADVVADMAKARTGWNLIFYRSHALVLDKKLDGIINNIVGIPPDAGRFDFLYPLGEGNIHVYGAKYEQCERNAMDTNRETIDYAIKRMKLMVPSLSEDDIITSYVGVRVFNDKEFEENIIEYSPINRHFINVLPRMPGFTPSSKIAEKVVDMLTRSGLEIKRKKNFNPIRKNIPRVRFFNYEEKEDLITKDTKYGHVICRCENVTEGEICEAIRRGAKTVQGVSFRTRAGMGRCQQNWCGRKIVEILSRELGVTYDKVNFKDNGSSILFGNR